MIIFPAVDIQGCHCVRLLQGRPEASKAYHAEPLQAALHWQERGARALHVVDLDAALKGSDENRSHVEQILRRLTIPAQVGGGLRSTQQVQRVLGCGAARAIVGTRAAVEPEWAIDLCRRFAGRVVIALDAREDEIVIEGWQQGSGRRAEDLARCLAQGGPAAFLYTDVLRDGMLTRPNFDGVRRLLGATSVPVIASGGVSSLEDLHCLGECGADGAIVGKALYENRFGLDEALEVGGRFGSRLSPGPDADSEADASEAGCSG